MLAEMIDAAVNKKIERDFPHLKLPAGKYARITKVQEYPGYYEYNLKILDENRAIDGNFPEIPGVKSFVKFEDGDTVTVLLLYGQIIVHIVGKVV